MKNEQIIYIYIYIFFWGGVFLKINLLNNISRDMSLDYCVIGAEDQVKHTVSDFNDIGPEFSITLRVSQNN